MPGCCALGCANSDKKGFKMNVFPRDPDRRNQWAIKVGRANWTPTNTSYLCESHFNEDQWESRREDNKRKLKWNAIPTIFSYNNTDKSKRKVPNIEFVAVDSVEIDIETDNEIKECSPNAESVEQSLPFPSTSDDQSARANEVQKTRLLEQKLEVYQKLLARSERNRNILKCKLRLERKKNEALLKERQNNKYYAVLKQCFNDDQIQSLSRKSNNFKKWSTETIKHAIQLKFSYGGRGYEELREQKIPLPSLRTIRRRKLENI